MHDTTPKQELEFAATGEQIGDAIITQIHVFERQMCETRERQRRIEESGLKQGQDAKSVAAEKAMGKEVYGSSQPVYAEMELLSTSLG